MGVQDESDLPRYLGDKSECLGPTTKMQRHKEKFSAVYRPYNSAKSIYDVIYDR